MFQTLPLNFSNIPRKNISPKDFQAISSVAYKSPRIVLNKYQMEPWK